MNIGKKLLSLLTVFCLTLSLVPTVALAEETSTNSVATEVKIEKASYAGNPITLNVNTPYLASNGSAASDHQPSGGYAYFHDGILTLNGFTHTKGISATGNLMIELKGDNKIGTESYSYNGDTPNNDIIIEKEDSIHVNLTIIGDGSLTLKKAVNSTLFVNGDLTIKEGAKVTAEGGRDGQAIDAKGNIIVDGTNTELTATQGHLWAIQAGNGSGTITVQNGAKIKSDTIHVNNTNGFIVDGTAQTFVANQEFESTDVSKYGINIGDTEITSSNKDNVLRDGTVSYDPATSTLTLNGATITDIIQKTGNGNLTINVVGENSITTSNNCIHLKEGNLTITTNDASKSGTLITTAIDGQTAIYVNGDITINNGVKVTAKNTFSYDNNSLNPYGGGNAMDLQGHNLTITGHGTNVTAEKLPTYGFSIFSIYRVSTLTVSDGAMLTSRSTGTAVSATTVQYPLNSTIKVSSDDPNTTEGNAPPPSYNLSTYKYVYIGAGNDSAVAVQPENKPQAVFTATGTNTGTLTSVTNGMQYKIGDTSEWQDISSESVIFDNLDLCKIYVKQPGSIAQNKADSDSQLIEITRAKKPKNLTSTGCTTLANHDGKISGVTTAMEYQKQGATNWTPISGDSGTIEDLEPGDYYVRVKASGTVLASSSTTVTVAPSNLVLVTGVTLNKTTLSMKVGESDTLTATVAPTNATNQAVTWTSSNEAVATVTNGKVTAVGVGTATITVTTADGSYTASCTVTVTRASSSGGSHTTYYPVNTPAKSEGGSVVVSQKSASKGSAVTVTVTPESGYQVSSVQAVDKDGKRLTLTDKGDGKYSFVMPGSKVEVSASFVQVQKPEEPSPYRDVSKDSYYYDAVQWASNKGITNGVADGVFAPDWVCTRGQIVTFLWRSVGSPTPKTAEMPFADVAEDAYYAQAVLWAVENGITKGTSETTFSPDQTCTRAHAVAFLYRLAGSPAVTGSSFQDVAADAYYNAAVAWAVQQGITNGTSETTFSPDETCTRAQIVTFLYRMDQAK